MEFLVARLDFWPYNFDDQKREMLSTHLGADLELTKVYHLYEIMENFGKPVVKQSIKLVPQNEEVVDIRPL
jgi:hypothetical protein